MKKFTKQEDLFLKRNYKKIPCKRMSAMLGRAECSAKQRLRRLGIEVPKEIAEKFKRENQFAKGQVPPNKGKKWSEFMSKEGQRNSRKTTFKKGQVSANHRPVGSERICSKDGYVLVKYKEGLRGWKHKHVVLWESKRGKVPAGHAVIFRDGNKQNITLRNLKLVSRADLMRKNTYHNYPKEIAQLVQLRGALTRQINKKCKTSNP